jgi:putative membrane protein
MSPVEVFPPLNASLNALSGVLLVIAYVHIRAKRVALHRRFMLSACATSLLFLVSYVTYHSLRGGVVTKFAGSGWVKTLYLAILASHTVLAIVILPMAIASVVLGLRNRVAKHRAIARWTFPLWLYVSITGVLVYVFLYHLYPSPA